MHWRNLPEALGLAGKELVSFVGGGGKTTALFALARHTTRTTVITTTTKMGRDRTGGVELLVAPSDEEIATGLEQHRSVIVWSDVDDHRAIGVTGDDCGRYLDLAEVVAVEADGSRRRPFKAPLAYEPVVPAATSVLVACCGMAAVGAPIEQGCHRPERVAAITGLDVDQPLTPAALVEVLMSREGSAKGRPESARYAVLLNRVRPEHADVVAEIRELVSARTVDVPVLAIDELPVAELPDHVG